MNLVHPNIVATYSHNVRRIVNAAGNDRGDHKTYIIQVSAAMLPLCCALLMLRCLLCLLRAMCTLTWLHVLCML